MKIIGNNNQPFAKDAASGKNVTDNKDSTANIGSSGKLQSSSFEALGTISSKITARLDSIPEKNIDRINELKLAINNGTYKIDPEKIADGLIRESIDDFMLSKG